MKTIYETEKLTEKTNLDVLTLVPKKGTKEEWFNAIASLGVRTYTVAEVKATGQPLNYGRYFARCVANGVFIKESDFFDVQREVHIRRAAHGCARSGAYVEATKPGIVVRGNEMENYDKAAGLDKSKIGTVKNLPIVLVAIAIGVLVYFLFGRQRG